MLHLLRTLRQAHLDRQKWIAAGLVHIDALDGIFPEGSYCSLDDRSIRQNAAWKELFAREEWQSTDAGHDGQCRICGAAVERQASACGQCGAVWLRPESTEVMRAQVTFGAASVFVSSAFGYVSAEFVARALRRLVGEGAWRDEFVGFVEHYLWVSDAMLFLLFCTTLYERLGIVPKGTWRPQEEDHETWKTERLSDRDDG